MIRMQMYLKKTTMTFGIFNYIVFLCYSNLIDSMMIVLPPYMIFLPTKCLVGKNNKHIFAV